MLQLPSDSGWLRVSGREQPVLGARPIVPRGIAGRGAMSPEASKGKVHITETVSLGPEASAEEAGVGRAGPHDMCRFQAQGVLGSCYSPCAWGDTIGSWSSPWGAVGCAGCTGPGRAPTRVAGIPG